MLIFSVEVTCFPMGSRPSIIFNDLHMRVSKVLDQKAVLGTGENVNKLLFTD